jgi:DNA-binding MarR family transcriptional regulator
VLLAKLAMNQKSMSQNRAARSCLGEAPMSVVRLAEAVGMDKGQFRPALTGLVSRKLVSRTVNPRDNREVLVCLTRTGLAARDAMVTAALERNIACWNQPGKERSAARTCRSSDRNRRQNARR